MRYDDFISSKLLIDSLHKIHCGKLHGVIANYYIPKKMDKPSQFYQTRNYNK